MSKKTLEFESIDQRNGSRISLSIYPPGQWFNSPLYCVFVGGCGRGKHKSLAKAKRSLLKLAIAECDGLIASAKAEVEHYERERQRLIARGLRAGKESR